MCDSTSKIKSVKVSMLPVTKMATFDFYPSNCGTLQNPSKKKIIYLRNAIKIVLKFLSSAQEIEEIKKPPPYDVTRSEGNLRCVAPVSSYSSVTVTEQCDGLTFLQVPQVITAICNVIFKEKKINNVTGLLCNINPLLLLTLINCRLKFKQEIPHRRHLLISLTQMRRLLSIFCELGISLTKLFKEKIHTLTS